MADKSLAPAYNYTEITSATTTAIKAAPGLLHSVTVNLAVANATIKVYDNTSATGTPLATITLPATVANPVTVIYDAILLTGLTVVTSGATDVTVTWQ